MIFFKIPTRTKNASDIFQNTDTNEEHVLRTLKTTRTIKYNSHRTKKSTTALFELDNKEMTLKDRKLEIGLTIAQ